MRLLGKDKQTLDMSQDKYVEAFQKSMKSWSEKTGNDKDGSTYGYVDIEGLDLQPFGTPYAN